MKTHSTYRLSSSDGSTATELKGMPSAREAAEIKSLWQREDDTALSDRFQNQQLLQRHKSLILNLVLEDCAKLANGEQGSTLPLSLAKRYVGLGGSLEKSIVRQLEVQQYLGEHPELLTVEPDITWPEPGELLQRYLILEELGRGAIARVYLCREEELGGRLVVVKLSFGYSQFEASLLGQLDHPNIVPVHTAEFVQETGAFLICMPFVGRSTFADLVALAFAEKKSPSSNTLSEAARYWLTDSDRNALNLHGLDQHRQSGENYLDAAVALGKKLAEALQYAHARGVVHGDIKPSNVLLSFGGEPLLFDFNLGRELSALEGPTGGTLPYMAPELVEAISAPSCDALPNPSPSSDIYSFGALLFELVCGRPPVEPAESESLSEPPAQDLYHRMKAGHPDASDLNTNVNRTLNQLINDCLQFCSEDRPSTMQEVVERLQYERFARRKFGRSLLRNKKKYAFGFGLLTLTVVMLGCFVVTRAPYSARMYQQAVQDSESGELQASVAKLDRILVKDSQHVPARLLRAQNHLVLGEFPAAKSDLEEIRKESRSPEAMALIGYHFNLTNDHSLAVPWYESYLSEGNQSPEVLNNLGMSLFLGKGSSIDRRSRLKKAYGFLKKAGAMAPNSVDIRRNVVRLEFEMVQSGLGEEVPIDPSKIEWLCKRYPGDGEVNAMAFHLYCFWMEYEPSYSSLALVKLERSILLGTAPSLETLAKAQQFALLRQEARYAELINRLERRLDRSDPPKQPRSTTFVLPDVLKR